MKIAIPAFLLAFCCGAPALATSGFSCRPVEQGGPGLDLVVGHGAGPAIAQASLRESEGDLLGTAGERPALLIAQSWIDAERLWLDLTDRNAARYEARLRLALRSGARGAGLSGTIDRGGRIWRVRCIES